MRLGMIGYGAIGKAVCEALAGDPNINIPAVLVRRSREAKEGEPFMMTEPERFFGQSFDVVLEGAGHQAIRDYGEKALASGSDLIVTSTGVFAADEGLYERCVEAAERAGSRLIIASAGIGGLDILTAAAVAGLEAVRMTVRKHPDAWKGTVAEETHDLASLVEPTVLFEGSPREGAKLYPQNVNISASVSLAGIGLDKTELRIIADPTITTHVAELEASGAFGSFRFVEDLIPSESNPKTSTLVAQAVVKTLRQMASPVVIGA